MPDVTQELVSLIVEKLANYLAGPCCGQAAVDHMLDEGVGDGVAEQASGGAVDDDAFLCGHASKL